MAECNLGISDISDSNFNLDEAPIACCEKSCSLMIPSDLAMALRLTMRTRYPTKKMKKQFILDYLLTNADRFSRSSATFSLCGGDVCQKAWLSTYGLSESLMKKAIRLFKKGKTEVPMLPNQKTIRSKSMMVLGWMENYFQRTCEKAPNTGHWYLPCYMTKKALYDVYRQYYQVDFVSHSQFCDLWSKHYKHVTIPAESRFSKCDLCSAIKEERQLSTTSLEKRQLLDRLFTKHNDLQMSERLAYYQRVDKAISAPGEYLSIIIDSMDQSKLLVPRLSVQRKATADAWCLRTHLIAAIVHGKFAAGAFDIFQFPHDSNLTCNFLLNILVHSKELPPVLYLQLDNCWRENKNRFLIGFIAHLVKKHIFKQAYVCFLMKGHTHDDIDQLFSQYSNDFLRKHNVLTMKELFDRWERCLIRKNSQRQTPLVYLTTTIFDIKTWLQPHLNDFHGHTGPHAFQILLDSSEQPVFKWKQWSSSNEDWQPSGDGIRIFKSEPVAMPQYVAPCADKLDVTRVQQSIEKMLDDPAVRVFSSEHKEWWQDFWAQFPNRIMQVHPTEWFLPKLEDTCRVRDSGKEITKQHVDADLCDLAEVTDNPAINVYIGHQSNPLVRQVVDVENIVIAIGQKVAIFQQSLYETSPLPLIGEIKEILEEGSTEWVKVSMWYGAYSSPWQPPKKPHYEWITKDAIILYDFELTSKNKLHRATKKNCRNCMLNMLKMKSNSKINAL